MDSLREQHGLSSANLAIGNELERSSYTNILTDTHRGSAEDGRERVVYKVEVVE
jgi:hypothetical protein